MSGLSDRQFDPRLIRKAWDHSPLVLKRSLKWGIRHAPRRRVKWGNLRRTRPFSQQFGYERGTPVDRYYIEHFLADHRADICGRVLEVRDPMYTDRFGGPRVADRAVVDIDPENLRATIIADICVPASLPPTAFDCIVFTQTLQLLPAVEATLENLWQSLAPGGTLLITVPSLSRLAPRSHGPDLWRWTPEGLGRLLTSMLPDAKIDVTGSGNVLAGIAFLHGLATEELETEELDDVDAAFPLVACARVRRPRSDGRP